MQKKEMKRNDVEGTIYVYVISIPLIDIRIVNMLSATKCAVLGSNAVRFGSSTWRSDDIVCSWRGSIL